MKTKKQFVPAKCSFDQIARVRRDHFAIGDLCLMTDGHTVWLSEQPLGQKPKQRFEIPRATFNRLIRWYQRPQVAIRP